MVVLHLVGKQCKSLKSSKEILNMTWKFSFCDREWHTKDSVLLQGLHVLHHPWVIMWALHSFRFRCVRFGRFTRLKVKVFVAEGR